MRQFRLEQLDDETGMKRLADLTQEEYVKTVNEMRQVLLSSWMTDRRVQALKVSNLFSVVQFILCCSRLPSNWQSCSVPRRFHRSIRVNSSW